MPIFISWIRLFELLWYEDFLSILSSYAGGALIIFRGKFTHYSPFQFNDRNIIASGADETLQSHLLCFSAEESRVKGKVIVL